MSAYFPLAWIFILYFPHSTPITFLMVHLTLRAQLPNLLSDAKWPSEPNSAAERVRGPSLSFIQWRIQRRDPGGPGHPLFLDQTETRRAEKNFFWDRPPPHLKVWMTWTPPPLSQGLDPALLFTTQNLTIRRLCCHSSQSWQGRGRGDINWNTFYFSKYINIQDSFYWQMFHNLKFLRMNGSAAERVHCTSLSFIQWQIQGRGPEGPAPLLFLDQTKARRVEKNFLETCPPPPPFI